VSEEIQGLTPAELRRKTQVGHVVSAKMDKTVVVAVERLTHHTLYHKTIKRTKRFMAHDEHETCQVGDRVRIVETRPLSRHKRWRVVEIIAHDALVSEEGVAAVALSPETEEEKVEDVTVVRAEAEAVDSSLGPVMDEEEAPDTAPDTEVEVGE